MAHFSWFQPQILDSLNSPLAYRNSIQSLKWCGSNIQYQSLGQLGNLGVEENATTRRPVDEHL